MNIFNSAIETHAEWKLKLLQQLTHGKMELDANTMKDPHVCELGQWVNDEGRQYSFLPLFQRMCSEHKEFHGLAGEMIEYINVGDLAKAKEMLIHSGPLRQSSAKLVNALKECGKELDSSAVKGITVTDTVNNILKDKTNRTIIEVDCDTSVLDAIKLMAKHNVGSLAVNKDGNYIGFFSERGYIPFSATLRI